MTIIIAFPPGAGGNHLKNIITSDVEKLDYTTRTVHQHQIGGNRRNLQSTQIRQATTDPHAGHVLHGHFGEIMSFRDEIRIIQNKKFIIVSPGSLTDQNMLNQRLQKIGNQYIRDGYFKGEQVFLYEAFIYHYCFQIPMENIMNIAISEWFIPDITQVVHRLNFFLKSNLDPIKINKLHSVWYKLNTK